MQESEVLQRSGRATKMSKHGVGDLYASVEKSVVFVERVLRATQSTRRVSPKMPRRAKYAAILRRQKQYLGYPHTFHSTSHLHHLVFLGLCEDFIIPIHPVKPLVGEVNEKPKCARVTYS